MSIPLFRRTSLKYIILVFSVLLMSCSTNRTTISENEIIKPQQLPEITTAPVDQISQDDLINVNNVSVESPDGKLLAESYGVNTGVTSGGLYPAEGIRIVELSSNKALWQMDGYYDTSFLWSDDSRYLAVTYTAAIYADTVVIDTKDLSEITVPIPEDMLKNMREYRSDPYFEATKWIDNESILIKFKWIGNDEKLYSGTFVYMPSSGEISKVIINSESVG